MNSPLALTNTELAVDPLPNGRNGWRPALVLFFLAPLVGEVLAGSTPIDLLGSPATFVIVFLLEALLYGGGAILIREVTRRAGRGWPTILGLGLAYGVVEEGLVTQSFFNPGYLGLHLLGFGNLFGLGWVWITDLLALHAVWSIAVPIVITEQLFRNSATQPWLSRVGLSVVSGLLAVGMIAMYLATQSTEHFRAPWPQLTGALVVAIALVGLAVGIPQRPRQAPQSTTPAPRPWLAAVIAFLAGSLFMGVHLLYLAVPNLPGMVPVAATAMIAVAMLVVVLRWSRRSAWGPNHYLALAAGALFTYIWNGFFTIPLSDRLDVAGQVGMSLLAIALVAVLARRSTSVNRTSHEVGT